MKMTELKHKEIIAALQDLVVGTVDVEYEHSCNRIQIEKGDKRLVIHAAYGMSVTQTAPREVSIPVEE